MGPLARALPHWETLGSGPASDLYSDRSIAPEETVRRMWPHLAELGITRLARQTGLDRLGIPCWAAFRPNSKNLATAQGKGLTDAAAAASALMEAAEIAVAEAPILERRRASRRQLAAQDVRFFDPNRLLPEDRPLSDDLVITWVPGLDPVHETPVLVPLDLVDMDGEHHELSGVCKTSNGLASGNTIDEALFHSLCELVERDGTTLWSVLPDERAYATAFAPRDLRDPKVDELVASIEKAGHRVVLFDQTTDLGIPVVMAVLGPNDLGGAAALEVAAGYGAHPIAARAALRAITEAAQSHVTSIAASRDDIEPKAFGSMLAETNRRLLTTSPHARPPTGLTGQHDVSGLISVMTGALDSIGCSITVVPLPTDDLPCAVVRVLSIGLEDRDANLNWRPGPRAMEALAA